MTEEGFGIAWHHSHWPQSLQRLHGGQAPEGLGFPDTGSQEEHKENGRECCDEAFVWTPLTVSRSKMEKGDRATPRVELAGTGTRKVVECAKPGAGPFKGEQPKLIKMQRRQSHSLMTTLLLCIHSGRETIKDKTEVNKTRYPENIHLQFTDTPDGSTHHLSRDP